VGGGFSGDRLSFFHEIGDDQIDRVLEMLERFLLRVTPGMGRRQGGDICAPDGFVVWLVRPLILLEHHLKEVAFQLWSFREGNGVEVGDEGSLPNGRGIRQYDARWAVGRRGIFRSWLAVRKAAASRPPWATLPKACSTAAGNAASSRTSAARSPLHDALRAPVVT
jgi:hypothetical protein